MSTRSDAFRQSTSSLDAFVLQKEAELYESWASGVLTECEDMSDAVALLTLVPRKKNPADGTEAAADPCDRRARRCCCRRVARSRRARRGSDPRASQARRC